MKVCKLLPDSSRKHRSKKEDGEWYELIFAANGTFGTFALVQKDGLLSTVELHRVRSVKTVY